MQIRIKFLRVSFLNFCPIPMWLENSTETRVRILSRVESVNELEGRLMTESLHWPLLDISKFQAENCTTRY